MQEKKYQSFEEIKKALEYYCSYQDRCHKEVETKLKQYNLIPEAKEEIILSLINENFLNEERFANSFARGKFRIKKWGKQRITRELKFKGVSSYNINNALKEIDANEYIETLNEIAAKRFEIINETNPYKKKKKLTDYLFRKGFESNLIYETVNKLF